VRLLHLRRRCVRHLRRLLGRRVRAERVLRLLGRHRGRSEAGRSRGVRDRLRRLRVVALGGGRVPGLVDRRGRRPEAALPAEGRRRRRTETALVLLGRRRERGRRRRGTETALARRAETAGRGRRADRRRRGSKAAGAGRRTAAETTGRTAAETTGGTGRRAAAETAGGAGGRTGRRTAAETAGGRRRRAEAPLPLRRSEAGGRRWGAEARRRTEARRRRRGGPEPAWIRGPAETLRGPEARGRRRRSTERGRRSRRPDGRRADGAVLVGGGRGRAATGTDHVHPSREDRTRGTGSREGRAGRARPRRAEVRRPGQHTVLGRAWIKKKCRGIAGRPTRGGRAAAADAGDRRGGGKRVTGGHAIRLEGPEEAEAARQPRVWRDAGWSRASPSRRGRGPPCRRGRAGRRGGRGAPRRARRPRPCRCGGCA
jgi:hypothetical protein